MEEKASTGLSTLRTNPGTIWTRPARACIREENIPEMKTQPKGHRTDVLKETKQRDIKDNKIKSEDSDQRIIIYNV